MSPENVPPRGPFPAPDRLRRRGLYSAATPVGWGCFRVRTHTRGIVKLSSGQGGAETTLVVSSQESTTMSFTVTVRCPGCQTPLKIPDELLGKTLTCPSCKQTFRGGCAQAALHPRHQPPGPGRSRHGLSFARKTTRSISTSKNAPLGAAALRMFMTTDRAARVAMTTMITTTDRGVPAGITTTMTRPPTPARAAAAPRCWPFCPSCSSVSRC